MVASGLQEDLIFAVPTNCGIEVAACHCCCHRDMLLHLLRGTSAKAQPARPIMMAVKSRCLLSQTVLCRAQETLTFFDS